MDFIFLSLLLFDHVILLGNNLVFHRIYIRVSIQHDNVVRRIF